MSVWRHIAAGREGAGYTPRPCTSDCTTQHSNDVAPQAYYIRFEFHLQERRKGRAFAFWRCWVSKARHRFMFPADSQGGENSPPTGAAGF